MKCTVKGCRKKAVVFGRILGRRAGLCKKHGVMVGVLRDDIKIIVHSKDEANPLGRIEVIKVKRK